MIEEMLPRDVLAGDQVFTAVPTDPVTGEWGGEREPMGTVHTVVDDGDRFTVHFTDDSMAVYQPDEPVAVQRPDAG